MNLKWYVEIGCHSPLQYYRPGIPRKDLVAFYTPTFFPRHQILGLEAFSESQKPVFLILWWSFLAFCGVMQGCSLPDFRRVGVRNSGTPCLASEVYMSFYSLRKVGEVEHLETTSLCCKNSVSHWPEASSPCATIGSLGSNEEVPVTLPFILRDTNDYRSHWLAWLSGGVVILDQNVLMSHRPWLMGCQVCWERRSLTQCFDVLSFVPPLTSLFVFHLCDQSPLQPTAFIFTKDDNFWSSLWRGPCGHLHQCPHGNGVPRTRARWATQIWQRGGIRTVQSRWGCFSTWAEFEVKRKGSAWATCSLGWLWLTSLGRWPYLWTIFALTRRQLKVANLAMRCSSEFSQLPLHCLTCLRSLPFLHT